MSKKLTKFRLLLEKYPYGIICYLQTYLINKIYKYSCIKEQFKRNTAKVSRAHDRFI